MNIPEIRYINLFFLSLYIDSQSGPHQGDPLGPLLFCLPLQPLLSNLSSPLNIGYLDDLTLGGDISLVSQDVNNIITKAETMGLHLNPGKCEVISYLSPTELPYPLNNFSPTSIDNVHLLGAPLSTGSSLQDALSTCLDELTLGISRLAALPRQDALILLRSSLSFSPLLHILRCTPCYDLPLLQNFDKTLMNGLSKILNITLPDRSWRQAALPIRDGGLGIRRVCSMALPAFLASSVSTASLQDDILSNCPIQPESTLIDALNQWSTLTGIATPEMPEASKQSLWDRPLIQKEFQSLQMSITSDYDQARINAVTSPHSSDWLHALPISSCGLRLDDEAVRVATGLRLGTDLCFPHTCPCGATVSTNGSHGMSCLLGSGRIARHAAMNDIIWRSLTKAGFPSTKEPSGLSLSDNKRPDGITLIPWENGRCLAWDATIIDTLADSYRSRSAETAGAAAEIAAERKSTKYSNTLPEYCFIPLAFETLGPINQAGLDFLRRLGRLLTSITGEPRETFFLHQRISVIIQRFNSVAFHGTFATPQLE